MNTELIFELCSHCSYENSFYWNINIDGYKAYCNYCGAIIFLCTKCLENKKHCDGWNNCTKRLK